MMMRQKIIIRHAIPLRTRVHWPGCHLILQVNVATNWNIEAFLNLAEFRISLTWRRPRFERLSSVPDFSPFPVSELPVSWSHFRSPSPYLSQLRRWSGATAAGTFRGGWSSSGLEFFKHLGQLLDIYGAVSSKTHALDKLTLQPKPGIQPEVQHFHCF